VDCQVYCLVIVEWLCIVNKKWDTNSPSCSYDNRVGVIKMNDPSLLIGQSRYTVDFLVLFKMVTNSLHVDVWVCVVATTCLVDSLIH
jgi:hypothetical protein